MTLGDKIVTVISLILLTTVSVAGFELAGDYPLSGTIGPFNHGERLATPTRPVVDCAMKSAIAC